MSKKEKTKKQGPIWITLLIRQGTPLFFQYTVNIGTYKYFRKLYGLDFGFKNYKYRDIDGVVQMDGNELGVASKLIEEKIKKGELKQISEPVVKQCDRLIKISNKISKLKWQNIDNSELEKWFTIYIEQVKTLTPSLPGIPITEIVVQEKILSKLKEILKNKKEANKTDYYLNKLIFPNKKSLHEEATIELTQIAALVQKDSKLKRLFQKAPHEIINELSNSQKPLLSQLNNYSKKYGFMNMEYFDGEPMTTAEVIDNIKNLVALKNCNKALKEIHRHDRETKQQYKRVVKELKIIQDILGLIEFAQESFYIRQHRSDTLFLAGFCVRGFIEEIAKRMGLTYDDIMYITPEEVIRFLKTGERIDDKDLKKREQGFGLYLLNGKLNIITGNQLKKEISIEEKRVPELKEFTGAATYSGTYRGQAKIVAKKEQIQKMEKGDILVSPMTDPYFLPAITKAGAIVTDEGGILSHAAIVAREFGIPCIVGTKIATKILKDGDIIEVDANRGIVRKLWKV